MGGSSVHGKQTKHLGCDSCSKSLAGGLVLTNSRVAMATAGPPAPARLPRGKHRGEWELNYSVFRVSSREMGRN